MEKEIVTQVMLLLDQSKDDQFWTLIFFVYWCGYPKFMASNLYIKSC